jgi:hypothetical protein
VEVRSVRVVDPAKISLADARRAGYRHPDEVRAQLRPPLSEVPWGEGGPQDKPVHQVYRVEFQRLDEPDPRDTLAHDAGLTPADVAAIDTRLDRLDRASSFGPWTRPTLDLIAGQPSVRAPDLAASVGRETAPFKLDVRKLKNLGLTISLRIGYRLSPRGQAYLDAYHRAHPDRRPGTPGGIDPMAQ